MKLWIYSYNDGDRYDSDILVSDTEDNAIEQAYKDLMEAYGYDSIEEVKRRETVEVYPITYYANYDIIVKEKTQE